MSEGGRITPGHDRDHAAYGASETVPIHTWPRPPAVLVSDVGTLTPAEAATVTIARNAFRRGDALGPALSGGLLAIVDRLSGVTPSRPA